MTDGEHSLRASRPPHLSPGMSWRFSTAVAEARVAKTATKRVENCMFKLLEDLSYASELSCC